MKEPRVSSTYVLLMLIFFPLILSWTMYKSIQIDNFNLISVVSATAAIQFWIWAIFLAGAISISFLCRKMELSKIIVINLILILGLIITSNLISLALSLKGTPLPPYDIRGDLGNLVKLSKYAQLYGWSGDLRVNGSFYPPIWVSIIGNVARILEVHVLSLFKPMEFIILLLNPVVTYILWRKLVPHVLSLLITIFVSLGSNNWKNFGLNILLPLLLIIFLNIYRGDESALKNKLFDYVYGLILGLVILWYFGNFWWGILFFGALIVISIFFDSRKKYLSRQIRIYLALGTVVLPVLIESYFKFNYVIFLLLGIFLVVINEIIEMSKILSKLKNYIFGIFAPILILYIFFKIKTNDDWFEGVEINPATNFFGVLKDLNFMFILALFIFLSIFALQLNWIRNISFFLIGLIFSANFGMFFLASKMYELNQVNLWPRAKDLQFYCFNILLIIFIYSAIYKIYEYSLASNLIKEFKNFKISFIYFNLFIFFLIISFNLASATFNQMPTQSFNGAWYAHQACSNPHVDPMLAKTFEDQPDVEIFLRKKCWGNDWPLVNKSQ